MHIAHVKFFSLLALLAISGCEKGNIDRDAKEPTNMGSQQVTDAAAIMTRSMPVIDDRCVNGGVQVDLGFDTNRNGALDDNEVLNSELICNGADGQNGEPGADGQDGQDGQDGLPGADGQDGQDGLPGADGQDGKDGLPGKDGIATLISITDEIAGVNCVSGGVKVSVGQDNNSDALLSNEEIAQTRYICNGIDGNDGQDGASGGSSGSRGPAGQDGANGKDGLNTLLRVMPELAGANCANGGQRIAAGLDVNRNSQLDESEVDSASYICNARNGIGGSSNSDRLIASNPIVVEGGVARFKLTLSEPATIPTEFYYSTMNASAVAGMDYLASSGKVVFQPGDTTKDVTVETLTDRFFEAPELLMLQVAGFGENVTAFAEITQPEFTTALQTALTNTAIGSNIVIELSDDVADIASDAIQVVSQAGTVVDGVAEYAKQGNGTPILRFTPSASLALNTTYTVSTNPVTTTGLNQEKTIANFEFTTEDQAFAYRSVPAENLNSSSSLWQWLANGTAREIKSVNDPLTFASEGIDYNGLHYFAGSVVADATSQLYVTDGSSHGTKVLTDAEGIALVDNPNNFTLFNGKLYFTANNADDTLQQLWTTDGTVEGTVAIANTEAVAISELTVVGDQLYFVNQGLLWVLDATNVATQLTSEGVEFISQLTVFNDNAYFAGYQEIGQNIELFKVVNGKIELALELNKVENQSSDFQNLQVINNQLFFSAEPTSGARFAYLYDGTDAQKIIGGAQIAGSIQTASITNTDYILEGINAKYLRAFNSETEIATFNSTNGLITTPAGVVVVGEMTVDSVATTGLWLFTDATAPAAPVITVEAGTVAIEGLVGDQLLYSVTVNAVTEYFLTDLVSKSETGETVVTPVTNELGAL